MNRRVGVATECALWLFLAYSAIGLYGLWRAGELKDVDRIAITLGFPGMASLATMALAYLVPPIFAVDSIRFPLNITLPILSAGFCFLSLTLAANLGSGLQRIPEHVAPAMVWFEPPYFGSAIILQVVVLTIMGGRKPDSIESC